jgi:hypothetical protein
VSPEPVLELVLLDDDARPQLVVSDQPPPAAGQDAGEATGSGDGA